MKSLSWTRRFLKIAKGERSAILRLPSKFSSRKISTPIPITYDGSTTSTVIAFCYRWIAPLLPPTPPLLRLSRWTENGPPLLSQRQLLSHWNWPQLSRRPDVCMYMVSGIDGTNRRNNWDEERLWSIERGKMKFSRNLKTCSIKKVENDRFVRFKFSSLYNSIRMRMFNGECLIQSEN